MNRISFGVLALAGLAGSAMAQTWNEFGDAGNLPGVAQAVTGVGALTTINGATDNVGGDFMDYYLIEISNPAAFSASTAASLGTMTDSQLFIFNVNGTGAFANDDISGSNFLSEIPAGSVGSLAPGQYLLGVAGYGVLPAWNATPALASLVFNSSPFTGVRTPQNTNVHSTFLFFQGADSGSYTVTLTGASFVPTPGAAALLGLGLVASGRRRRA
jgi:MYXO-CTERM domain-containing protein